MDALPALVSMQQTPLRCSPVVQATCVKQSVSVVESVVGENISRQKSQKRSENVVADAVVFEPVSTLKFPANMEKNREVFDFGATARLPRESKTGNATRSIHQSDQGPRFVV